MKGFFTTDNSITVEFSIEPGRSASQYDPGYGPQVEIGRVTWRGRSLENISLRNTDRLRDMALEFQTEADERFAEAEIRDTEWRGHIALSAAD